MNIKIILALVAIYAINMGTVNIATAQQAQRSKYKNQLAQTQIGQLQLKYLAPDKFQRIDGLARDIDEMLVFFTPNNVQNLAIFAEPKSWEIFYNEIYGANPRDLNFYATITTGTDSSTKPLTPKRLSRYYSNVLILDASMRPLNDGEMGSQFLENGQNAATSFEIMDQSSNYLTFKTKLGQMKKGKDGVLTFQERYYLISSTIAIGSNIICLSLFFNKKGATEEEALRVALAWRNAYMDLTKPLISKTEVAETPKPVIPVTVPLPSKLTEPSKPSAPAISTEKINGDRAVLTGKLPAENQDAPDEKEKTSPILDKPAN